MARRIPGYVGNHGRSSRGSHCRSGFVHLRRCSAIVSISSMPGSGVNCSHPESILLADKLETAAWTWDTRSEVLGWIVDIGPLNSSVANAEITKLHALRLQKSWAQKSVAAWKVPLLMDSKSLIHLLHPPFVVSPGKNTLYVGNRGCDLLGSHRRSRFVHLCGCGGAVDVLLSGSGVKCLHTRSTLPLYGLGSAASRISRKLTRWLAQKPNLLGFGCISSDGDSEKRLQHQRSMILRFNV